MKKIFKVTQAVFMAVLATVVMSATGCRNIAESERLGITMVKMTGGVVPLTNSYKPTVRSFYISQTEITQKQWREIVGNYGYGTEGPSDRYGQGDDFPMYYVSWYDALVFCNRLSVIEGRTPCYALGGDKNAITSAIPPEINSSDWNNNVSCDWGADGYRLPTEAEWEYVARGGSMNPFTTYSGTVGSDEFALKKVAWYGGNSGGKSHTVGTMRTNAHLVKDMSGNVYEWCWDWKADYDTGQPTDPKGTAVPPSSGSFRVMRGGSCDSSPADCAVSCRNDGEPYLRSHAVGFRVVSLVSNFYGGGGGSAGGVERWTADSIGIKMLTIPEKTGTDYIQSFKLAETELTQKQYKEILDWAKSDSAVRAKYSDITKANSNPSDFKDNPAPGEKQENRPVEQVTWGDAVMYCNLLTMREMGESECVYDINILDWTGNGQIWNVTVNEIPGKKGYRLPYGNEWRHAFKGGQNYKYAGTPAVEELKYYAWYIDTPDVDGKTHEVKKKLENGYNLYDMNGNVEEWCGGSVTQGNANLRYKLGGGWGTIAANCDVGISGTEFFYEHSGRIGFRVARSQ